MQKQKIQLEKVQVDAKLKKVEEDLLQVEDANTKVFRVLFILNFHIEHVNKAINHRGCHDGFKHLILKAFRSASHTGLWLLRGASSADVKLQDRETSNIAKEMLVISFCWKD